MDFIVFMTIISAVCGVLSFFMSNVFKTRRWVWAVVVFLLTFACCYAVYYNSKYQRIKNIHRQASTIERHYSSVSFNKEFIQEALVFLEENKDIYPDAYERALNIYSDMKNQVIQYDNEAAMELHGIIKGVSYINKE